MDEKKDVFIRKKLKEDELISKKADDIFKNFLEEGIDMENETKKLTNDKKEKIRKYNKWIATAACLVVIFGGANVYASSNGYKNLFFMIKYLVTGDESIIEGKDEILADRAYTISYNKIALTEHLSIQIRELQIQNGEAKLILSIDEDLKAIEDESELPNIAEYNEGIVPLQYKVYDEDDNQLCSQQSSRTGWDGIYSEELILNNYKNDTTILKLRIDKENVELLANIKINLEDRTIEVEGEQESLEKISEIELKEWLGNMTNLWDNWGLTEKEALIDTAITMGKKYSWLDFDNITSYKVEDVEKIVNSFSGKSVKDYYGEVYEQQIEVDEDGTESAIYPENDLEIDYFARVTKNNTEYFEYNPIDELGRTGYCIDISDISYCSGIYTVTFTYIDELMKNDDVDEEYIYQNTVTFKLNENSEYSKFKILSYGESVNIGENDAEDEFSVADNNITSNTVNSNTNEQINNSISNSNSKFSDETVKQSLQEYLNLIGAREGAPSSVLIRLNLLEKEEDGEAITASNGNSYIKTDIKYSDFKQTMMNYMTEECFYTEFFKDDCFIEQDGFVCYFNGGGSGMSWKVESVTKKSDNSDYTAKAYVFYDETEELTSFEFGIEDYNGKCVISYCD